MTTPINNAGGSTPSDEVVTVMVAVTRAIMNAEPVEGFPVPDDQLALFRYGKDCALDAARAAIAAMPAPSVDPVGEVGEMIAIFRRAGIGLGSEDWTKYAARGITVADCERAATLLQQLADDNARLRRMDAVLHKWLNNAERITASKAYLAFVQNLRREMDTALTPEPFVGEPETRSEGKP